jgi:hypothetical protein
LSQKRFSNRRERLPNKTKQISIGVNNIKKYKIPIHKLNINSTNSNSNDNNNNVKDMTNKLGNKVENIEDSYEEENFFNFMRFDLKRKITKKDIEWEYKCYSIWDPELSD